MPRIALATPAVRERAAAGKAIRKAVPRESHGDYDAGERPDARALLDAVAAHRLPYLVPLRDERMAASAFTYFRGAAVVMAADLARTPATGIRVQACGDAHCLNFGGYASPERNMLFDVNDFDETLPGAWEWDLKRLVTSIMIAARDGGHRKAQAKASARAAAFAYRQEIRRLAALPALDVWYTRLDATEILDAAKTLAAKRRRNTVSEQVATGTIREAVDKLTAGEGRERRFRDDPPALFHAAATERPGFDIDAILAGYQETLSDEMRFLLARYRQIDHAVKVVGVGSVGTRCAIVLLAADDHDPLLLQIKEAVSSVLEAYTEPSRYPQHGQRVVRGQRLMQTASDAFLGWASSGSHDFYVRQFRDMKSSADLQGIDPGGLRIYGRYCAIALAGGHARSGDAAAIAGYLGSGDVMDGALVRFAEAYALQNEHDFAAFSSAAKTPGES